MKAINAIKEQKLELVCLLSIMTYNFKEAEEVFSNAGVIHHSLCNLDTILEVALQRGIINSTDADKILKFRESHKEGWQP